MKLLVVESSAKAKTLNRILGKDYKVLPSMGHIYDLEHKQNAVDTENDFAVKYTLMPRSMTYVKSIISSAKEAEEVLLATDPDREGEIIAWHINQEIAAHGVNEDRIKRIAFQEITDAAVKKAVLNPRKINMDLVQAQQSRRILDYLIGFNLSPVLWRKLPGAKSAGRVQSAVLRLICEREIERNRFQTQEYWTVHCRLQNNNSKQTVETLLVAVDGKKLEKFDLSNADQINVLQKRIQGADFVCADVEDSEKSMRPKPPLITSTLQQMAFNRYKMSSSKVMQTAQKLYEGVTVDGKATGLITYMRTDSIQMSEEFTQKVREYVKKNLSADYIPSKAVQHAQINKRSQEAHECIRPTDIDIHPESIKEQLTEEQYRLYKLIWCQSVASQMSNALVQYRRLTFKHNDEDILCCGNMSRVNFDGFLRITQDNDGENSQSTWIEGVKIGDKFNCEEVKGSQHFTEPPARYTEGSLIKTMEKHGIGRPSTYANVIEIMKTRNYVDVQKHALVPSNLGFAVTIFLCSLFRDYTDCDFTADMEDSLDRIAVGELNRSEFLLNFWKFFAPQIEKVMQTDYQKINNIIFDYLQAEQLWDKGKTCEKCGSDMQFRIIYGNPVYSCSRYPECKNYVPIFGGPSQSTNLLWHDEKGNVYLRTGLYGMYLSLEDDAGSEDGKPIKTVSIPQSYSNASIEILRILMRCPWELGRDAEGRVITLCCGRYGPYLQYNNQNIPVRKIQDLQKLDIEIALNIIEQFTTRAKSPSKRTRAKK